MTSARERADLRCAIDDVVQGGCLHLDAGDTAAWLALASDQLRYRITAYSPEIRKDMTWLEHDRSGLVALFELLPRHHVDHARWFRHAVLQQVVRDGDHAHAVSGLAVYHTVSDVGDVLADAGATHLFAVGRYHDRLRLESGSWRLLDRTVRLDTRQLGLGSHLIV
jgi:methanesulfonate monooxygenase subunit beta